MRLCVCACAYIHTCLKITTLCVYFGLLFCLCQQRAINSPMLIKGSDCTGKSKVKHLMWPGKRATKEKGESKVSQNPHGKKPRQRIVALKTKVILTVWGLNTGLNIINVFKHTCKRNVSICAPSGGYICHVHSKMALSRAQKYLQLNKKILMLE